MSQKGTNNVKQPVHGKGDAEAGNLMKENKNDQFHGENTKSLQDDRKISNQGNGAGRPPMMKK